MKIFRFVLLILHLGIFFLLGGTLLNAYVPPKVFPWLNLLSLAFPVLITGYVILTLFWVFSWKKRAFVFLLLGLMFIKPVTRWINYTPAKKKEINLKIVSFNAKAAQFGIENIEKYIDSLDADIVLLQECGNIRPYQLKLKEYKTNYVVTIFSNYTIIRQQELISNDYDENDNAKATLTDIKIKGEKYRIINAYLQPFKFEKQMVNLNGNNEENEQKLKNIVKKLFPIFKKHQEEVEMIRKAIDNSPYPVILAGDFNSVPNSYEYYRLSEGLQDAFAEAGSGSATSFHDYKFPIRIDYIFASKSIKPVSYKVDRSVRLSDHYPVIATFSLNN